MGSPKGPGAGLARPNQISPILIRGDATVKSVIQDGELVISVRARAEDDIQTNQAGLDLADPTVIPALEKAFSTSLEHRIRSMVKLAQETYQADVFGFGELIHREHPKVWREIRENWHAVFSQLKIDVQADIKVRRTGLTGRPASLREEQLTR